MSESWKNFIRAVIGLDVALRLPVRVQWRGGEDVGRFRGAQREVRHGRECYLSARFGFWNELNRTRAGEERITRPYLCTWLECCPCNIQRRLIPLEWHFASVWHRSFTVMTMKFDRISTHARRGTLISLRIEVKCTSRVQRRTSAA